MHPFIKHLLLDIKNAEKSGENALGYLAPQTIEEELEEIDRYINNENEQTFIQLTGLQPSDFPPSDQLSNEDMEVVLEAYDTMLDSWKISIEWPENMPIKDRYDFLLKEVLNDSINPMYSGCVHIDYCTGNSTDCVWGKYCYCLRFV